MQRELRGGWSLVIGRCPRCIHRGVQGGLYGRGRLLWRTGVGLMCGRSSPPVCSPGAKWDRIGTAICCAAHWRGELLRVQAHACYERVGILILDPYAELGWRTEPSAACGFAEEEIGMPRLGV